MEKDFVLDIMTDVVNKINREMSETYNIDPVKTEEFIESQQQSFRYVNGRIYDALKEVGVIL